MTQFSPGWPLRHANLQSALASFRGRNWPRRAHPMAQCATAHLFDCGEEDGSTIRLEGHYSPHAPVRSSRGLVVLIHGWEGCHTSAYLFSLACTLYDAGYSVVRLNLRDHGATHHLNRKLFHSGRLDEVLRAIKACEQLEPDTPLFVVGFSLGGNFALRVGMRGEAMGVRPGLCIGLCPAIDPRATMTALDNGPKAFHRYFTRKWRRTLRAKQAAWPGSFDFSDLLSLSNFMEITARFAERHTEYGSLDAYFAQYTLTPEMIRASPSPLAIITAQDDPVVPFSYFKGLADSDELRFLAPKYGGHCGFIENFRLRSWAEKRILELLATESDRPA